MFIARISSVYGGTIRSFKTKEHLKNDSSLVELISQENKNNLILIIKILPEKISLLMMAGFYKKKKIRFL